MDDPRQPLPNPGAGLRIGRAAFLGTVAAGVAGIALGPRLSRMLGSGPTGLLGDLSAFTGGGWRIYAIESPLPRFDPVAYRLRVHGEVAHPLELDWQAVQGLPAVNQVSTFHCVTGWTVDGVRWHGVRGTALMDMVKPTARARYVTFRSLERSYVDQLTIDQFALPDVMLATLMNDAPISRDHGAPLRLVIPRMYGYKGVKWVDEIRFDATPSPGYWEQNGYDVDAWVGHSNGL
ncbi:MAG: molybdopterin-dependent oxidoreductase [Thermoleophilia bacterium]